MSTDWQQELVDRFNYAGFVEACRLLEEGIATAKDIDLAMRAGAGYPAGPLGWADAVGLDAVLARLEELRHQYGDTFAPPQVLRDLVKRGDLGEKTGKGFLEHAIL